MSFQMSRQLFRPIGQLHNALQQVGKNNLDVHVPVLQSDELGELAQQFNRMVIDLKRNQQLLVDNQRALNEAQIRMLQAQLNPHFLCNTLDTMKWISKINQVPQVALMSTDLADILRFCIRPEEFVSLRQEVEVLKRFLAVGSLAHDHAVQRRPVHRQNDALADHFFIFNDQYLQHGRTPPFVSRAAWR